MEYRRFEDTIMLRLDAGEEICESIVRLARMEEIALAEVTGVGAACEIELGVYDLERQRFCVNCFRGVFEMASITGNITGTPEAPHLHLHLCAADAGGRVLGGHVSRAIISVTAEIVVRVLNGRVIRVHNDHKGIDEMEFGD